ncbi:MAG: hypothetical protein NUV46_02020 [Nanoarchaeota archaeon]|nr:hypothetical protein [Nanoarchaeota archaeon]
MEEEDLTLPEDEFEKDSKSIFGEERKRSKKEENILKKQKEFEYEEIGKRKIREINEKREKSKERNFRIFIGALAILFLIFLYFWLLN